MMNIGLRTLLYCFLLIVGERVIAQTDIFGDLTQHLNKKPKMTLAFDNRNTFLLGQNANIIGIRAGLDFNGRVRVGLGGHRLNTLIPRILILGPDNNQTDSATLKTEIALDYLALYSECAFFKSKRWEFGIPVYLGLGRAAYRDDGNRYKNAVVSLLETSLYGQFYIFSWLAFHGGSGYRIMLKTNKDITGRLSGPVYTLGVKVCVGEAYRSIFTRKS
jgi:hypothetical protein